uniref:Uncharacterized protein n=1 Tax=viral metagenome TaxID=1070528 RepID=A0A6C0B326_9ZZZZ
MSKFRKPVVDISSTVHFPLLTSVSELASEKPVWNCEKISRFSDNAKYFENGDVYEGYFDELGLPCYGKMTFANGNVYHGPIRDLWIKDDEQDDEEEEVDSDGWISKVPCDLATRNEETISEDEYYDDYYYEEDEPEKEQTYGKMTYPDGKVFWGVFCFAQRSKWI